MRFICVASEHTILFYSHTGDILNIGDINVHHNINEDNVGIDHVSVTTNISPTLIIIEGNGLPNQNTDSDCIHNQLVVGVNGNHVPTNWICPNGLNDILYDPGCESQNYDCDGICNGNTPVDVCGICGGSGKNQYGCCGDDNVQDVGCGCGIPNDSCDGVCGSVAEIDYCGVCGGNNLSLNCNNVCTDLNNNETLWVLDKDANCCHQDDIGFCNTCISISDNQDTFYDPQCCDDESASLEECNTSDINMNLIPSLCDDIESNRDICGLCDSNNENKGICLDCDDSKINDDGTCSWCDVDQRKTESGECVYCTEGKTNLQSFMETSCSPCNLSANHIPGDSNNDGFLNIVDVMKLIFHNNVKSCNHECLNDSTPAIERLDTKFCHANVVQKKSNTYPNDDGVEYDTSNKLDLHDLHVMIESIVGSSLNKNSILHHGAKLDGNDVTTIEVIESSAAQDCYNLCSSNGLCNYFEHHYLNGNCRLLQVADDASIIQSDNTNLYEME
jgi:hypothetical protein